MKVDLPKTSSQYDNNEEIYEHESKYISFSQSQKCRKF